MIYKNYNCIFWRTFNESNWQSLKFKAYYERYANIYINQKSMMKNICFI